MIALFRAFMQELTPPALKRPFDAYVERAIREELSCIADYYGESFWVAEDDGATAEAFCRKAGYRKMVLSTSELQTAAMRLYEASSYRRVREETAMQGSHKTVGAGLKRFHYEKAL